MRDGQVKVVGGIVTGLNRRYTKRGELMGTFFLEDLGGSIEVFVFPKVMQVFGALLADDGVVVVKGRIDTRDEQVKLVCMELSFPTLVAEGSSRAASAASAQRSDRRPARAPEGGPVGAPRRRAGLLERRSEDLAAPVSVQRRQPGPGG